MLSGQSVPASRGSASSGQASKSSFLAIAGLMFVGALALTALLVWGADWVRQSHDLVVYAALTVTVSLLMAMCIRSWSVRPVQGQLDLLEPPVWYSVWTIVSLVLFGFVPLLDQAYVLPALGTDTSWLVRGLLLIVIGLVALWGGYRFGWLIGLSVPGSSASRGAHGRKMSEPRPPLVILLYTLIMGSRLLRISTIGTAYFEDASGLGALGGFLQWWNYFDQASYLLIAIIAGQVFRRRWPQRALVALLGIELAFAFLSGFMKPVLRLTLIVLGAAYYSRQRIRTRPQILAPLLIALILIVPVTEQFRWLVGSGYVNNRSLSSVVAGAGEAMGQVWNNPDQGIQVLRDKVIARQSRIAQGLGLIVRLTPNNIPFWGVEKLLMIPLYLIPRAIWAGKPNLSLGVYFNVLYFGAPTSATSSAAYTVFGDLYLHAGWPAVGIGMFILGIALSLLYRHLVVNPLRNGAPAWIALYLGLFVFVADIEGSYIGLTQGLIQRIVVFGFLFLLIHRREVNSGSRRSGSAPGSRH